ncbi:MAG: hypothetical protein M0P64_01185 [Candidatus Pacebacteria bacterium]|jgi:hypothetical protein|nr:hypothetical protein [Candidatus Paceibacterota bacterium]
MYQRQTLLLGALVSIFCVPLFVFAQTSTTTAEQPNASDAFQQKINELIQRQLDAAPTAEEILIKAVADNLEVKTVPSKPSPNESVKVSIQSYLIDLNKASIVWTLNGKVALSGVGEKVFTFTTGNSGETTTLLVSMTANTGEVITKEFSWTPVGVTLFWEADTYTPPFYKGKPLLSYEAKVTVIATPDNTDSKNALSAGNLVYTWKKKGMTDASVSGYGKNSFSFTGPRPFSTTNASVLVSSVDDAINSEAKVNLSLSTPFILFYENHPLLGTLYNKPFGKGMSLSSKELSISAAPYFFSKEPATTQTMQYNWTTNGRPVQNEGKNITLRNEKGEVGSAEVSLSVRGLRQTFQTASQNLRIDFTEDTSNKPLF